LEKKITKREQRAIETLINDYLAKERAFYRLNERFVSNKTGDVIFSTKKFRTVQTISNELPTRAETQNFSLKKK